MPKGCSALMILGTFVLRWYIDSTYVILIIVMNEKTFVLIKLNVQNSKKLECECWWTAFGEVTASRWTSEELERPNDEKKKN